MERLSGLNELKAARARDVINSLNLAVNGYPTLFRAGEGEGDERRVAYHLSYTVSGTS